jgi:ABC-2 type transport system ATP-binding protein
MQEPGSASTGAPAAPAVAHVTGLGKVYEPTPAWMRFLVRSVIKEPITALSGVHLELREGDICAVVGPNGAGKTTMFRILVGLTTPTTGHATVAGFDAAEESEAARRRIGWMPAEDRSLFMRLTCRENLRFHGSVHGIRHSQLDRRITTTLEQVGLAAKADSSVFALSAGMRARLQLARAILHRPALLILDEPTGSVDPVGSHQLLTLIMDLVTENRLAALISSHRLEEIEALHSHVILLDRGQVRFQGDLDALRGQFDRPRIEIVFTRPHDAEIAAALIAQAGEVDCPSPVLVRCLPHPGVTTGDVLGRLGAHASAAQHFREVPTPLRDLLAELYRPRPSYAADSP